jgi:hypothetical protein
MVAATGGVIGGVATAPPAAAAACSGATGVTVVVDHGSLGGGIDQVCSPSGGGKTASSIFVGAGFSLTYVQQQPGFVCRINGQPASDACVRTPPSDAYWGLWWSDGKSGSWTYASVGAGSLNVPDGGYVGFAWQNGGQTAPGVPATAHASAPTPTPTQAPSQAPTSGGGGGHHGSPTAKPSTKPSAKPSTKPSTKPTTTPSATPTQAPSLSEDTASADTNGSAEATPTLPPSDSATVLATPTEGTTAATASSGATPVSVTADPGDPGTGGSLPVWVVPAVLVLLVGAGVAVLLVRRRHRPSP